MAGALETLMLDEVAPMETTKEQFHQQQTVYNYVHGALQIPQVGKPIGNLPVLPQDLTSLDDNQLGYQLSMFAQWVGYIDWHLANVDGERQQADAYLTFIQARVRIAIKAKGGEKKMTTKDKDDVTETNPEVVSAMQKQMFWESTYRLTKAVRDSVQLGWETISRRITQRGQEIERMRRETNIQNVPVMQQRPFMKRG